MKKENQVTIEQRINELSKWDLEIILLTLVEVDKHINVGTKTKREIRKQSAGNFHFLSRAGGYSMPEPTESAACTQGTGAAQHRRSAALGRRK